MTSGPIVSMCNRALGSSTGRSGFTLIEILVAIFILSIIMGLVFGSFNGVFSNADRLNESGDLFEMADVCLDRMMADLEALHVLHEPRYRIPEMADAPPDLFRIEGTEEAMGGNTFAKLRFTSLAHLAPDAEGGVFEIVYYVQPDEAEGYRLFRAENRYPYPEFEPRETDPVVCERLSAFKLTYYDKEGREFETWDSEDDDYEFSTPRAIRVQLKLGSEDNTYDFGTTVTLVVNRSVSPKR